MLFASLLLGLAAVGISSVDGQLVESERLQHYIERNYSWPVEHYIPDTPGWRKVMDERFAQLAEVDNSNERYNGYLQTVSSAIVAPNFTEHGFGLARAPDDLMADLRKAVREGAATAREEGKVDVILGPRPLFVDRPDLTHRVLHELKSYPEAWSGIELTPFRAYGFRLYRNQSSLLMHVDKMQTHIISFILHIDSSDDAEPWPIFIEDFQGNTHEVILTSGDMLFYESSKCFHGRPRKFVGSWYSSIFVHYYPKDGWQKVDHMMEAHYAVPPVWREAPVSHTHEEVKVVGTSLKHPNCPDDWCPIKDATKWSGPGKDGFYISPDFEHHPLNLKMFRDEL